MSFGFSMMWREGEDQVSNCYFCMANLKGINSMSKHHVQQPDVTSAIKSALHGPDLLVPELNVTMESSSYSESSDMTDTAECVWYKEDEQPVSLTQADFSNLTRDLNLSTESAQLLGSHL